jgi:hypothetical protein
MLKVDECLLVFPLFRNGIMEIQEQNAILSSLYLLLRVFANCKNKTRRKIPPIRDSRNYLLFVCVSKVK